MPKTHCDLCKQSVSGSGDLFSVPKDVHMRTEWEKVCKRKFSATNHICGAHFDADDYSTTANKRRRLNPFAVPSKLIPIAHSEIIER